MTSIAASLPKLISELPRIIGTFQEDTHARESDTPLHIISELGTHYYGIHKESQKRPDALVNLKKVVQISLKLSDESYIVQIIGDSRPFSREGTAAGYTFLKLAIDAHAYVLYGYTGSSFPKGPKCVNALTSAFLEDEHLLDRAIGNVVGYQTRSTLSSGSSKAPDLSHYVVVYSDNETSARTGTLFGDDVPTSDHLADRFLLLEGGCQSFLQACNALATGKLIRTLFGIRDPSSRSYFSAAEFLNFLHTECSKHPEEEITPHFLHSLKDTYLSTHTIADPKKRYYREKIRLFERAWTFFVENRLDKNFYLLKSHIP